ncbi:MAG: hypothetical protein PQJ60_14925 [Spirochaetales bacterium]|nr:hypothetical protein [Spirochaetales bacterium]
MRRCYLILLLWVPFFLGALTVEKGNFKIVADDETGGFLCYSRLSADSPWAPLLVESFTSSYVQLRLNGVDLLPGESREFSLTFEPSDAGLAVHYEGEGVRLTERLTIREDYRNTSYFAWELTLENWGNDVVEAGLKKVLDTAFVRGDTHFLVLGESVGEERAFEKDGLPPVLLSAGSRPGEKLYVRMATAGAGAPDRLLLVNWNRLDREGWDYDPPAGSNFNALPFSINDSALGFYWLPVRVEAGDSIRVSLSMGPYDFIPAEDGVVAEPSVESLPPVLSADPALARLHLEEQLVYIDLLLDDLEELLTQESAVTNGDILDLEERWDVLEQEKRDYEKLR